MIPYNEALQLWGLARLKKRYPNAKFVESTVTVEMNFNEGYACCGGSDPDCYCSYAESPSSDVTVSAQLAADFSRGKTWLGTLQAGCVVQDTQSAEDFDFAEMVKELFDIAVAEEQK